MLLDFSLKKLGGLFALWSKLTHISAYKRDKSRRSIYSRWYISRQCIQDRPPLFQLSFDHGASGYMYRASVCAVSPVSLVRGSNECRSIKGRETRHGRSWMEQKSHLIEIICRLTRVNALESTWKACLLHLALSHSLRVSHFNWGVFSKGLKSWAFIYLVVCLSLLCA